MQHVYSITLEVLVVLAAAINLVDVRGHVGTDGRITLTRLTVKEVSVEYR